MEKNITLKEIIHFLGDEIISVHGNPVKRTVKYLRAPDEVDEFTLDWINPRRKEKQKIAEKSKAKAIIVDPEIEFSEILKKQRKVILVVENPKLTVAKTAYKFFVEKIAPGIHSSAFIHPEAQIGREVFIGHNTTIGKCSIGNNVIIHANVTLYDNVIIKNNVHINSGSIIGADGLGCEREKDGRLVKFPHSGGVIIEDDVEIGAGCIIAKGALTNTVIGQGSKINVDCFIAHNCIIGQNVWISPKVNIAGSVSIMENTTIFSGAIIKEQRSIGKKAIIGMGSVVTKDVPDGETWIGNPARKMEHGKI